MPPNTVQNGDVVYDDVKSQCAEHSSFSLTYRREPDRQDNGADCVDRREGVRSCCHALHQMLATEPLPYAVINRHLYATSGPDSGQRNDEIRQVSAFSGQIHQLTRGTNNNLGQAQH
jgi:hypothetical protein